MALIDEKMVQNIIVVLITISLTMNETEQFLR